MSAGARYPVPAARHRSEITIDRSRFLCTIAPAPNSASAQQFVREMNAEFPDASHNCWAYVAGAPGSTGQIGLSDDGEPHGTAGRPMLTVLLHSGIGDIAAVVTRWFGGTKLGTGGLVKAYSLAVQQTLLDLPRSERVELLRCTVQVTYADIASMQHLWAQHEIEVLSERYETDVHYTLSLPKENYLSFEVAVRNATRGQAVIETEQESRETHDS